jgi:probable rRNA maturation factor
MGKIKIFFEDIPRIILFQKKLKEFIMEIIFQEKCLCGDINIVFCLDDYLLEINQKFLKHDFYTDIVTFDYSENNYVTGELYISMERLKENAELFRVNLINETVRVIIHGILHLVGYKDKSKEEKKLMKFKEDYYLSMYNLTRDVSLL